MIFLVLRPPRRRKLPSLTTENVTQRSCLYRHSFTFTQYVDRLQKACLILNIPISSWMTPSVRGGAKGIDNAIDMSLRFDSFIARGLFCRALIQFETHSAEDGRLFYTAYSFPIRSIPNDFPSLGLPLRIDSSKRPLEPTRRLLSYAYLRAPSSDKAQYSQAIPRWLSYVAP